MLKNYLASTLLIALLAAAPNRLQAQPSAHYCPGVEGIQAASLPPPGFYVRDYNVFYTADRLNNASGQSAGPANFNVFNYVHPANYDRVAAAGAEICGVIPKIETEAPVRYLYEFMAENRAQGQAIVFRLTRRF